MRKYSSGYVTKRGGFWRAVVNWQEDSEQKRLVKNTKVRCYKDRVDSDTGERTKDNRGKTLAETVLRSWRDELISQEVARQKAPASALCVSDYVLNYIYGKERSGTVRDVTTRGYRTHLKHLIGTSLGAMRMGDVGHEDITRWEQDLVSDGMAPTTLSHAHVFLKQVFDRARKVGDITSSPFDLVETPKRRNRPINALPPSEIARLRPALENLGCTPLATGATIALKTGMRVGEICALRWQDVDLESDVIHVSHALTRVKGHFELSSPKTATSVRAIPFGDSLKKALLLRRDAMRSECNEIGTGRTDGLFVIGPAASNTWKSPQGLSQEWHQLAQVLGLVGTQGHCPTFHDLRHTFATMAVSSGVDIKTVSVLLGHADPAMTLRVYADSLEDSKRAGMEKLDSIL